MIQKRLNHYTIIESLGQGGMGEVYVAEDSKLNRRVALKVLTGLTASDPERRARFEREAKAVAALNHPNIVTIHSVEEADGVPFLTMELVEGRLLSSLITPGGMPLDALLRTGIGISDAIAAAHQKGITHRDLKPANVMITNDGRVKVLDFGLAKLREAELDADGVTQMPASDLTGEGRIIGTIAYMSPEQAEGKVVDQRSDIFSLGRHAARDGNRGAAIQGRHERFGDVGHPQGHAELDHRRQSKAARRPCARDQARAGKGPVAPLSDGHGSAQRARGAEAGERHRADGFGHGCAPGNTGDGQVAARAVRGGDRSPSGRGGWLFLLQLGRRLASRRRDLRAGEVRASHDLPGPPKSPRYRQTGATWCTSRQKGSRACGFARPRR